MRGDELAHLGAELVDQEGPAGANDARRGGTDRLADARRKGREGQSRDDIIGMGEAMVGDDLLDLGRRSVDRDQPGIVDVLLEELDEILIGIDRDQFGVGCQPVEDRAGEGADAGAIFDEQFDLVPFDRPEHAVDQHLARRDDRSNHHRIPEEAAEELPFRADRPVRDPTDETARTLERTGGRNGHEVSGGREERHSRWQKRTALASFDARLCGVSSAA